jgi:hypothetical protein
MLSWCRVMLWCYLMMLSWCCVMLRRDVPEAKCLFLTLEEVRAEHTSVEQQDSLRGGDAVWCCVVPCGAVCAMYAMRCSVWCCVVLCGAVWCCVVLCGAVWCHVEPCGAVWCRVCYVSYAVLRVVLCVLCKLCGALCGAVRRANLQNGTVRRRCGVTRVLQECYKGERRVLQGI